MSLFRLRTSGGMIAQVSNRFSALFDWSDWCPIGPVVLDYAVPTNCFSPGLPAFYEISRLGK
jgi:hypothetical protein